MYGMNGISNIRFGGIASGLDTEKIIKDLMKIEQMKVDRVEQQKTTLEWKRDDYREINTKLLALRNSVFDLKLQGNFQTKKVSSSDETCLTAAAGANAVEGTYNIKIKSLASGVTAASSAAIGSNDTKTTLKDQFTGIADSISFELSNVVDGEVKTQSFTFDTASQSIHDVIKTINDSDLKIKASYDEGTDRFILMTDNMGSEAKIDIVSDDQAFLRDTLKMYSGDLPGAGSPVNIGTGTDAEIEFNGITGLKFSSNQFTFNNINLNLKNAAVDTTVSITVNNDIDAVVEKIKSFVENYNTIMEKINTKLSEKRYRDFPPLTEEQKKELSDKDIELWEEKAKSGLLNSDSLLNSINSEIRMSAMGAVSGIDGDYKTLSSIGINTAAWYDKGKLYIDEDDLREALAKDPEGVMNLFTNSSENTAEKGIAQRLYDSIDKAMDSITDKAGKAGVKIDQSFLGKEIDRADDRLADMQDRLINIENRYWAQFTAMEKALQQMQNQSNWLMGQLGMGGQ